MTREPRTALTRRRVLGGAMAGAVLPSAVRKALAATPPGKLGAPGDIKHVVLLMQENRSFDHYFGTMAGVRGFSDPHAMTLASGRSVFHQPTDHHPDGYILPYRLDCTHSAAQMIPSTDHSWDFLHDAWNHGAMDSWLSAHYRHDGDKHNVPYAMGYYDEADIPFHRAIASAFTICDGYHASMMGPTSPNRLYWETGTIDPDGAAGGPILSNEGVLRRWRTYAENLTEAGISWKCYHVRDGMASSLRYFKAFREASDSSPLRRNIAEGPLGQFEHDALHDRLPTVSWLFPPVWQNEHPSQSYPAAGAQFIAAKIAAIAANPEVWAKTVFILNYDENDGLFDHVPPPTPPVGEPGEYVTLRSSSGVRGGGRPIGAGFRVPCIIVSPWTAGGWVCSDRFDHTSTLQFLEKVTGVEAPNITPWRRRTFGDMLSAFRFDEAAAQPPQVPDALADLARAKVALASLPTANLPVGEQREPSQPAGHAKVTTPRQSG